MGQPIRTCMIGVGAMARFHLHQMFQLNTEVVVVSDPSDQAYQETAAVFLEAGKEPPPNEPDLAKLLNQYGDQLDTAFIITPHALHYDQTKRCLEAGLDVLLEKPMVMNAQEAQSLIEIRDRTGGLLVVAFQGGLSPEIRTASNMLHSGELGELLNISGTVWQDWKDLSANTWRVKPELSGGGFMFDTGAHMLNTISDLAGEDFVEVAAWQDNRGMEVDILGVMIGRLESGGLVTINACGDTVKTCESDIKIFCTEGIIHTGMWGERLLLQRETEPQEVDVPDSLGAWEQFLQVRNGEIPNPCPPEIGLRMARLWDAIKASANQNGVLVQCQPQTITQ